VNTQKDEPNPSMPPVWPPPPNVPRQPSDVAHLSASDLRDGVAEVSARKHLIWGCYFLAGVVLVPVVLAFAFAFLPSGVAAWLEVPARIVVLGLPTLSLYHGVRSAALGRVVAGLVVTAIAALLALLLAWGIFIA